MALNDFEHPECPCPADGLAPECKLHGVGTSLWGMAGINNPERRQIRTEQQPSISLPITIHTGKLDQYKRDLDNCRELLIESRNHAKLTQNLGLVRRIDRQLENMGVI